MVTRIIGIPDGNGIIRVSCGTDILEIQVVSPSAGGATVGGGSTPKPPDPPIVWNPGDLPGAYMRASQKADGTVDADQLLGRIQRQFNDPSEPSLQAVVVAAHKADLHDIGRLGTQINDAAPGVTLAIDFGGLKGR